MSDLEIRRVDWVDTCGNSGWTKAEGLATFGISICVSVGFLWSENDEEVVLVQSIDTRHDNVDSLIAIPKVAVAASKTIRKGRSARDCNEGPNV